MAYKFSRGERDLGDIEFEDDPGTGINFEDDEISLETDGTQRLLINNSGARITGSLELTGSAQSLITLHTRDADNLKEIVFYKDGSAAAAMQINSAEHFFIENEAAKDIILRTNNKNTIRIYGSSQRVGINQSTTANAELDIFGQVAISGSVAITGSLSFPDVIMTELSIPGVDVQTDTNAYRFNCPYDLTVESLELFLDQHSTSGNVTVTLTNTTDSNTMITLSIAGTNLSALTTSVSNAACGGGDIITFAITATPANAQGLRAILTFSRLIMIVGKRLRLSAGLFGRYF